MLRKRWIRMLACLFTLLLMGTAAMAAPRTTLLAIPPAPPERAPAGDKAAPGPLAMPLSYGPGDRVAGSDEEFVADYGYPLDSYLFRDEGPIIFDIDVTRYFGPVDGEGHLLHPENIYAPNGTVDLTLRVWDVDQDYSGGYYAPEVDKVYINGQYLGTLSGWNSQWSTVTFAVPVSALKFPSLNESGSVVPAANTIRVDVDTANVGVGEVWAVEVDWARLLLRGVRPTLLVHGFFSNAGTWDGWSLAGGFGEQNGLPVAAFSFADNTGSWAHHLLEEAQWVEAMKSRFGVEKINIVGHSKGGLDSRGYLAFRGSDEVENLIMMGTPNAGSPLADLVKAGTVVSSSLGLIATLGEPALTELTTGYMGYIFNSIVGSNPQTRYHTIAGDWWSLIGGNPLIPGPDDQIVALTSVEALPYASVLGRTSHKHTDMTAGNEEFQLAWSVLREDSVSVSSLRAGAAPAAARAEIASVPDPLNLTLLEVYELVAPPQTHAVALETGTPGVIAVLGTSAALSVSLVAPDGQPVTEATPGVAIIDQTVLGYTGRFYKIDAPQAGDYQVTVSGPEGALYLLAAASPESALSISAQPRQAVVAGGTQAILEATVYAPAGSPLLSQVEALVQAPDGSVATLALHDDGAGADLAAGDQLFTGEFLPVQAGFYAVVLRAGVQPLQRVTTTGFLALSGGDQIIQLAYHNGVDSNGDGLFESLAVGVDLTTAAMGDFLLSMRLEASDGRVLTQAGGPFSLPAGPSQISLAFDGQALGESGFEGDLYLSGSMLRADGQIADVRIPLAVLSGYDAGQFTRAPIRVLPGIQEQPLDLDSDGQYDELRITVPVQVATGGWYNFNARLVDSSLQEITWAGGSNYLSPGVNSLILAFQGRAIGEHGVDGPYLVRDFSIYGPHSLSRLLLHTTAAYRFTQFEGAAQLTDGLHILPPLSATDPVTLPAGQEIPIRFKWVVGGQPTLDRSVVVRIRDGANRLITGYSFGHGISYDPASGEYLQPFTPATYGLHAGDQVRIQVYFGSKLRATATVVLN